jgi:predicted nucleotidyltransferase
MEDIKIAKEFKKKVLKAYPEAEIYFFGSRVNKTHRDDSDYDLLVLLEDVTPSRRKAIYDIAWETGYKYDVLIAPVLSRRDNFYPSTASPFLNNVKKYGMVL